MDSVVLTLCSRKLVTVVVNVSMCFSRVHGLARETKTLTYHGMRPHTAASDESESSSTDAAKNALRPQLRSRAPSAFEEEVLTMSQFKSFFEVSTISGIRDWGSEVD